MSQHAPLGCAFSVAPSSSVDPRASSQQTATWQHATVPNARRCCQLATMVRCPCWNVTHSNVVGYPLAPATHATRTHAQQRRGATFAPRTAPVSKGLSFALQQTLANARLQFQQRWRNVGMEQSRVVFAPEWHPQTPTANGKQGCARRIHALVSCVPLARCANHRWSLERMPLTCAQRTCARE